MSDTHEVMQGVARGLDTIFNGRDRKKQNGFVLLVFPFKHTGKATVDYVSNAERKDIVAALKEIIARFEGMPYQEGEA